MQLTRIRSDQTLNKRKRRIVHNGHQQWEAFIRRSNRFGYRWICDEQFLCSFPPTDNKVVRKSLANTQIK